MIKINGEEVREIPDYKGYFIDRLANVYSNRSGEFKRVVSHDDHRGYYIISAKCNSRGKMYPLKVHHAMMYAWVGPKPQGAQVRHLDDDGYNNVLTNLKWGTSEENEQDQKNNCRTKKLGGQHKKKIGVCAANIMRRMLDRGFTVEDIVILTKHKGNRIRDILGMPKTERDELDSVLDRIDVEIEQESSSFMIDFNHE